MKKQLASHFPHHGGNLHLASEHYRLPREDWLDLSTGISPASYPVPTIPDDAWSHLSYIDDSIINSALRYYRGETTLLDNHKLTITAGSQFAISMLPSILESLPVILPTLGYREHEFAWQQSASKINYYDSLCIKAATNDIHALLEQNAAQHLVIINPNNPSQLFFSPQQLLALANKLAHPAKLIVDEAFIDLHKENSLTAIELPDNVIVLRSIGKFFGLAGLRVGCVLADQAISHQLATYQGPWPVAGPSLFLAQKAWEDSRWQTYQKQKIAVMYQATHALLDPVFSHIALFLNSSHDSSLFLSYLMDKDQADTLFDCFAKSGVLLRYLEVDKSQALIRVGLLDPENKNNITKFKACLCDFKKQHLPHLESANFTRNSINKTITERVDID